MTVKVIDGFDWFPSGKSSAVRAELWAANGWFHDRSWSNTVADVVTGRFGFGKAMRLYSEFSNASHFDAYIVPVDDLLTEGYFSAAIYYPDFNDYGDAKAWIAFYDGVYNQFQFTVVFRNNGVIEVRRGSYSGTILATTPTGSFEENRWMFLEIFGKVHDTNGEVEVRINTVQKINVVSSDTRGGTTTTTYDSIKMGCSGAASQAATLYVDDMTITDTAGSTMNTFMGNLRVKSQFMIADGYLNDFTIGGTSPAATNWQSVLNQDMDDTKYVYSPTIGDLDMYVPDPNLNAPYVRAVQVRMGLRQDDATQRSAKAVIRIGSTDYEDDVEHFVNQLYTFYFGIWELNPATGVTFTGAEVNALEVGVKVES